MAQHETVEKEAVGIATRYDSLYRKLGEDVNIAPKDANRLTETGEVLLQLSYPSPSAR